MPSHARTSPHRLAPARARLLTASAIALIALSACSSNPRKDHSPPELPKQPPLPVLPKPLPVQTESVGKWQVVQAADGQTLLALPARGFEALMRNLADMVRWSNEASYQLDFYRNSRQPDAPAKEEGK